LHLENSTTHTHTWYWGKSRKSFVFFPSPLTSISWWCCLVYSMSYSQNFVAFAYYKAEPTGVFVIHALIDSWASV
jgi:hypothetical protein